MAKRLTLAALDKEIKRLSSAIIIDVCGEAVERRGELSALRARVDSLGQKLSVVSADRMATQIDLEAETRRIDKLAVVDEVLAGRIDGVARQQHKDAADWMGLYGRQSDRMPLVNTFFGRLRWLLTGK